LHPGHIRLILLAARHCDYLVVGLQIDPSIDRPEKNRPIQTVEERREILEAIKGVGEVVVYSTEAELARILYELQPDVRVCGTDWQDKEITAPSAAKRVIWRERDDDWSSSVMRRRAWEAEEQAMFESEAGNEFQG